jgi:phage pi2 protein 07
VYLGLVRFKGFKFKRKVGEMMRYVVKCAMCDNLDLTPHKQKKILMEPKFFERYKFEDPPLDKQCHKPLSFWTFVIENMSEFLRRRFLKIYVYLNFLGFSGIRYERYLAFTKLLKNININPGAILDAGCGDAICSFWLAKRFPNAKIFACDIDEKGLLKNLELSKNWA